MNGRTLHIVGVMAMLAFLVMISPSPTKGQAWVPEKGQASISTSYEYSDVGDHLFSGDFIFEGTNFGKEVDFGDIKAHSAHLNLDYGISNKLALTASIPAVVSRYNGAVPDNPAVDDGNFHGGVQDFALGIRYMSLITPLVITPSVSIVIPSHKYETLGHVSIGRDLKELHVGLYLGKLLTFVSDNLYAQAGYNFAYTEAHDGLRANRSDVGLTFGYFVSPALSITTNMAYQKTHTGIDWLTDTDTEEGFHSHDRFAKATHLRLGGSLSVEVTDALNFYIGYGRTLWGENTHQIQSISLGTTWSLWIVD